MMGAPRIYAFLLVFISTSASISSAQLVGCDAIGCPNDPASQCRVGNATLTALGISEFNTTYSPDSLTWTVGLEPKLESPKYVKRDYFLGTPPSLNLANSTTVRSCALFFEGISMSLKFPGDQNFTEFLAGSCNDALGGSCVNDFVSQAQTEMKNVLDTAGQNWTESAICNALQSRLQNNAPASCKLAHEEGWGNVMAGVLTGPEAAPPTNLSDCHPTTGKDYNVSPVSSIDWVRMSTLDAEYKLINNFMYGITPVMTIFYPYAAGNASSANPSEVHLNCMKVVASTKNMIGGNFSGNGTMKGTASVTSQGNPIAILSAIFAMFMLL